MGGAVKYRIAELEAENVRLQSQLCMAQILVNQETDHYAEWKKQHDRIAALRAKLEQQT